MRNLKQIKDVDGLETLLWGYAGLSSEDLLERGLVEGKIQFTLNGGWDDTYGDFDDSPYGFPINLLSHVLEKGEQTLLEFVNTSLDFNGGLC